MNRTILHCDLNSCYASVELLTLPQLRELYAQCGDRVEISRSAHCTRLVRLADRNFYQVINQKLGGLMP